MLDQIAGSVLSGGIAPGAILLCTGASLALGMVIAGVYRIKNQYTKGMVVTLVVLPAVVQMVIMMVNGNIGAGVAVAGTFSLVRFRSAPGTARDIASIFLAMAVGLATGMGYVFFAATFLVLVGGVTALLFCSRFGEPNPRLRQLRITVPETLDYETAFDDLLVQHAKTYTLEQVKTTNMGSMFQLTYHLELRENGGAKAFLDGLRTRNGNLNITLSRPLSSKEEL